MGGSNLQLPTVSRPTDLAGEYTVPGPGNTYRASISSVSSTNYYYGWWGGYWWGAWGYYGSGYWYSGYGGYGGYDGYGGYLYGSQVSSAADVSLAEPQMQFPDSFWQIDASTANDPWAALEVQYRYGNANSEALVAQVELPEGSFTRLPTVDTKVSIGMKSVNDEVIDLMQELGDTAGDLWTLVGSTNLAPLAKRISTNLAELAPGLTQNELQQQSDSYSSSYLEQPVGDTSLASGAISVAPAADQSSSAVALQLVSENGELADEAETLTPEELEKAKQIAVETFAQQMLLKAAENSSVEIVQVILDQYKDNADLQNALIMMLQSYKVVTADAWWSDYWIDHETRTVYVSSKNNYYTRDAASIVGELSEAIRDDSQFYQLFGLAESWEGFSSRIGFGLMEAGGGALSVVGGALLIVAPEPTMLTKAGGGMAVTFGANSVVAGVSSLAGRESRVDVIGSGLEKYYDATGVDQDLRAWGHGALLVSNVASGFSGVKSSWGTIKSLLTNSKAFVQQSLTKFQELLHSGKSIREIAKIDDIKALITRAKTAVSQGDLASAAVNFGCFAGDTLCWVVDTDKTGDGIYASEHEFNAYQFGRNATSLISNCRETLVKIENIQLGQRILTQNPIQDEALYENANDGFSCWKQISLEVRHASGSVVDVDLLRPMEWIERNNVTVGQRFSFELTEIEIDGCGVVRSIFDAPDVDPGFGSVITGKFVTRAASDLVRVTLVDGTQITGTSKHPVWSPDVADWRGLGEFQPGHCMQSRDGLVTFVAVEFLPDAAPVYNFEVAGEHVYEITELGILVHNADGFDCQRYLELLRKRTTNTLTLAAERKEYLGLVKQLKNEDWGSYLRGLIGGPPDDMIRAHAHHILFKSGLGLNQRKLIVEGMEILLKYDIDPVYGLSNRVWAPNISGQHGIDALTRVITRLRNADNSGGGFDAIKNALEELGQTAANIKRY